MRGRSIQLGAAFAVASLLALPTFGAPEVTVLGGGGGADPAAICGDLAAAPYETGRDGPGLTDRQVFIDGAIAACETALAASPDSADVQSWLARAYILAGRREDARPLLEAAIQSGNPYAAYLMGKLLGDVLDGVLPEDPQRALDLLTVAAEGGFSPAMVELGELYEAGSVVEYDADEAIRLYEQASEAGNGLGSYRAGFFYHRGPGAPDFERAIALYELAISQGEPQGNTGIGSMYELGEGVEQDYARAAEYYELAAGAGEKIAQTSLAYLYEQGLGVPQDFGRSFALLTEASAQNWGFAHAALSIHYMFGQGTEVDLEKAVELAWQAQGAGVLYAQGILGFAYQQGMGVVRNLPLARDLYQRGADGGDQYSAAQLPIVEVEILCLDAAAAPHEPGVLRGVPFDSIDPQMAIPACEDAVDANDHIDNIVWLARALLRAGEFEGAVPLLEEGVTEGSLLAHVLLGELLLTGNGVAADPARGIALYETFADQPLSQFALGLAYARGLGVDADPALALDWLSKAERSGVSEAAIEIAALNSGPVDDAVDLTGFGREGPGY